MPSLQSNTVYLTLNTRGIRGTFHWGIFITTTAPSGIYYHATNKFGGWQLEVKSTRNLLSSMSLVLAFKIGDASSLEHMEYVLRGVPANGTPSIRTGEAFTCRTWTEDALMALYNQRLLDMGADLETIKREALAAAAAAEPDIEQGTGEAEIRNRNSSSRS